MKNLNNNKFLSVLVITLLIFTSVIIVSPSKSAEDCGSNNSDDIIDEELIKEKIFNKNNAHIISFEKDDKKIYLGTSINEISQIGIFSSFNTINNKSTIDFFECVADCWDIAWKDPNIEDYCGFLCDKCSDLWWIPMIGWSLCMWCFGCAVGIIAGCVKICLD